MKRIVIAPDSFKESLTAAKAAAAIERGFSRVFPKAAYVTVPIADGGEGTVDAIVTARDGRYVKKRVRGPLGTARQARYGLLDDGALAVIEMAAASGLELVPRGERDPLVASTYGTGELVRDALDRGARQIIVGVGGSATNDGGVGLAQALGVKFFDDEDRLLSDALGGGELHRIARVDVSGRHPALRRGLIRVACDVDNPLTGPKGASAVYGPQKGASPEVVKELDGKLKHLARIVRRDLGVDVARAPGAGAAGGLGYGLMAFTGARAVKGVDTILELAGLKAALIGADLVVTGEGRIDFQTAFGKAPAGVARWAARTRVPVVAIGGAVSRDARKLFEAGFSGIEASVTEICDVDTALKQAGRNLELAAERAARLIELGARQARRQRSRGSRGGRPRHES